MEMKLKCDKPVFTQCRCCSKIFDMVKWGIDCPTCKDKKPKSK